MAKDHRVFIAFAIEDEWARDYLVGQMRSERSPFQWTDMSVKQPWDDDWKARCLARLKTCDGLIALVSKNTNKAAGQLWEISAARGLRLPVMAMYTSQNDRPALLPAQLHSLTAQDWNWRNISAFLSGI